MQQLSERLLQLRNERNLTQKEVAENLCMQLKTYKNYEQQKNYPKIPTLIDIAEFYQVSLDYLAGISDERGKVCCPDIENFSKRVIEMRKRVGLSQSAIAKQLGITKSGYKYYEMGKNVPPLNRLIDLANIFHVTLEYLIGGQEM